MAPVADALVADVRDLQSRVATADITAVSIGNGAKELLDQVATGKVTGEEEAFSHTDLVGFAANVQGAEKAFEVLRPIVQTNDPALVTTLEAAFGQVDDTLTQYERGNGYVSYDTVGPAERASWRRSWTPWASRSHSWPRPPPEDGHRLVTETA